MSLHSPRLAPSCASLAPNVTPHAAAQMFHVKHSRGNSAKHGSPPLPPARAEGLRAAGAPARTAAAAITRRQLSFRPPPRQERPPLTFHAPCVPAPRALRTSRPRPARLVRPCGACPSAPRASSHPCPFSHLAPPSIASAPLLTLRAVRSVRPSAARAPAPRALCGLASPPPGCLARLCSPAPSHLLRLPLRVFSRRRACHAPAPPRPHAPRVRACRSRSLGRHGNVVFPLYSGRQSIGFCAMLEAQLDERGRRRRIDLCGQKRAARRTFSQQTSRCAHPLSSAVFYSLRAKR